MTSCHDRRKAYLFVVILLGATFFAALRAGSETAGVWLGVPFIKQTENGCGSATLAMFLQYWSAHGAAVAPERADANAIQRTLYSPKLHGITASDMQKYLTDSGFRAFAFEGSWSDLREHLTKGRPLIVSLRPGRYGPFHYVVVVGVDWAQDAAFVNDPARGKLLRLERQEFEKEWSAVRNWTLLAVPASAN
jgi:ABC-type bacteriocin/lantibiotic exporter with double-glycine peptidase domain